MTQVVIRDVETHSEYREIEELQKQVWDFNERDIVPLSQMIAAKATGGILLSAYEESTMIGFVYGFVGCEDGCLTVHSHMLAVKPEFRGENIGLLLKLAQRNQALAQGIKVITWTFDPLQSLNAYLNIEKLGVIAVAYKINFYGETSSALHKDIGTDRLWVKWELESERVESHLQGGAKAFLDPQNQIPLVRCGGDGEPLRSDLKFQQVPTLVIEIPANIGTLQKDRPRCAVRWREVTREAFLHAFDAGYIVTAFQRMPGPSGPLGAYILTPASPRL